MTPIEWQRVRTLFHAALDLAPDQRLAFVEAESGDAAIAREVASLLAAYPAAEGFLSGPGAAAAPSPDATPRLATGARLGAFEIRGLVGAGGMGEVYRAHDARLGRDVAIKVLPSHVRGDAEAVERLTREARAIAALSHPGILTIHDIGHDDGQVYLVTELLDGESLRSRVRRGPVPWREALDIGASIAGALAAAHARGIVHRDLKPENVVVTASGAVKLLDFGVAKHVDGIAGAATTRELTATGAAVGTLAYMAPEQLEGRHVDHRADQFALGVLLHEIVAGRHPFAGTSGHEIAAAILRDTPSSLAEAVPGTPPALSRAVDRCLARAADQRYTSTNDLTLALIDARTDAAATPRASATTAPPPSRSPGPVWRIRAAGIAAVVGAGYAAWTLTSHTPVESPAATARARDERRVAVLPFVTMGDGEPYLADGVTEAVTRELGRVKTVQVVASNTSFAYRQRADAIGRELGVGLLVQGSVQRAADRVRINTTLVDAARGTTLWSERYDRDAANVLAIQDDIAWQVAAHLASAVGSAVPDRPSPSPGTNAAAYDAYLRGLSHLKGRSGIVDAGQRLAAAIAELERSVSLDPKFALGHAMVASVYTQRFFYDATDPTFEQRAFLEIEKALAINPDQAEAYLARAQIVWNVRNGFQHERAIADLRRALANNPSLAEAHTELAKIYYHIGLTDLAVAASDAAMRIDPVATVVARRKFTALLDAGRHAEAAEFQASRPSGLNPQLDAEALLATGHRPEALAAIEAQRPTNSRGADFRDWEINRLGVLAHAYAVNGRRADAARVIETLIPRAVNPTGLSDLHHVHLSLGTAMAALGRHDEAVKWLTKAADEGYPSYPRFANDPDLAPVRDHPGFVALLARLRRDWERWKTTL